MQKYLRSYGREEEKEKLEFRGSGLGKIGMRGFCILSFSLLFLVAKFSNPIWPGPLFHVKQHFWIIFFLLSVFLFNVSRETIVNWNNVSLWIGRWWYEFVIRLFVCVYNLWVALFWDFGIRSWRNFLLFFIAVIEFEDADFFCWKWQIVLFHYAWRLNNVFLEWMSFVATLSRADDQFFTCEKSYLIEKHFLILFWDLDELSVASEK